MYGHRQQSHSGGIAVGAGNRIPDLIEALRGECEALQQECNYLKHHREDFDTKAQDMAVVHKMISELEKTHLRMKQQYEDEIRRLKLELESMQRPVNHGSVAALSFHPLPQLEQEMQSIGASFLTTPVPGIPESSNSGYFIKRSSDNEHMKSGSRSDDLAGRNGKHVPEPQPPQGQKDQSGGYDWLVVYNPKVPKTMAVRLVYTLEHDSVVCAVRFSPSGRLLAAGSNRAVRLFDAKSGALLATLKDNAMDSGPEQEEQQFFRSLTFSPDERLLASGAEDSVIRVWDTQSKSLVCRLEGHEQDVYALEFYDNGTKLASGSGDKTVRLWDLATRRCLNTLHAGTPDSSKDSGITSLSVSPNGRFLAAGSLDRLIRIWNLPSGQPVDVIEGHQDSIYSISFAADGRHLISGSLDRTVRIWAFESDVQLKGASCLHDMSGHKDFVLSVTGSPDGRWVLTGSKDRSVQCWDRSTGNVQFMLQGHKNSVIGIAFAPNGAFFATASGDHRARIWAFEPYEAANSPTATNSSTEEPEAKQRRRDQDEDLEMEEAAAEQDDEDLNGDEEDDEDDEE